MEAGSSENHIQSQNPLNPMDTLLHDMQNVTDSSSVQVVSPQPPTKPKNPNTKIALLLIIFAICISVAAARTYYYFRSQKKSSQVAVIPQITPTPFELKAKVQYLTGSASKIMDECKVEILEGDILDEGDVIETGEDTRLVISFDEGSVLRIDAESRVTLSMLTSPLSSVTQDSGNVFYKVNKDDMHKFEVLAGEVIIESSGTAYSVEKQEDVKVKVFESKVKILSEDAETEVSKDQEWNEKSQEITDIDKKKLATSEFYQWSLKEENMVTPTTTPNPKPVVTTKPQVSDSYKIKAWAKKVPGGIEITWESSINSPKGYKVIKNLTGSPVYPGDEFKYMNDANARSVKWELQDGKTWHFRVCQYLGGKCGEYSNEVIITADRISLDSSTSNVASITLNSVKKNESTASLSWTVDGTAFKGYKIVWSTNTEPTYPPRNGDWVVATTKESYEIGSLESGKIYYFRVCERLTGSCGTYSNQTNLTF